MRAMLMGISLSVFLASCVSVNPYDVAEGEGAYLQNTSEQTGTARFTYYFTSAVTAAGTKKFHNTELATIAIPPGEISVGITLRYFPEGSITDLSFEENMALTTKAMLLSSEAQERHDYLTYGIKVFVFNTKGWEGIKLNAVAGETYHAKSRIENGKASIWIEDSSGERVSDAHDGYGLHSGEYWLWATLPEPVMQSVPSVGNQSDVDKGHETEQEATTGLERECNPPTYKDIRDGYKCAR